MSIIPATAISCMVRPGNHMWETNFVPDLEQLELQAWADRGGGSTNIMFVLADGIMHAHISEMPTGTYKKGHRHGPGAHVMCVVGTGYSLLWFDGDKDFLRIDWKHGVVFPPADRQFHQHFNTCEPAGALSRDRRRQPALSAHRGEAALLGHHDARAPRARSRPASRRAATRSSTRIRILASIRCGSKRCAKMAPSRRWTNTFPARSGPRRSNDGAVMINQCDNASRHPEVRAQRASKDDPVLARSKRAWQRGTGSPFEARLRRAPQGDGARVII